jgi:hypothetical protein
MPSIASEHLHAHRSPPRLRHITTASHRKLLTLTLHLTYTPPS